MDSSDAQKRVSARLMRDLGTQAADPADLIARSTSPPAEEQFRQLYDAVTSGVLVHDDAGVVVYANVAAGILLGMPPRNLCGRAPVGRLWQAEREDGTSLPDDEHPAVQALRTRAPVLGTVVHVTRPDSTTCWLQADAIPVVQSETGVVHVVTTLTDVSGRKAAEQQASALVRIEKMRALGEMAGGVAHDLNQSLTLIIGHGDLALGYLEDDDPDLTTVREALRSIIDAASDGADTVKRLQTFARSRSDEPATSLSLGELLRDLAKLTAPKWRDEPQAQGRSIRLHVEVEGDTTIDGWPGTLREAFTNLIFNAVDALPVGGTLVLAARRRGSEVEAEVTDSGVGMTPEVMARVFEPFFSTKGDRGTGLGLAVVYGIVERHGGTVRVNSAPGLGTTFRLTFPASTPMVPPRLGPSLSPGAGGLRVLVVDDELTMREMVVGMLAPHGYSVSIVASAEAALRRLAAEPFDVVVSDVSMGAGLDGWGLAEIVRAHHPGIRFVLTTGWHVDLDEKDLARRGVDVLLPKPYRGSELLKVLEQG